MPKEQKWKEVKANFFKLTTPGDSCQGTYVDKKIVPSTLPGQEKTNQTIYTLIQDDGSPIYLGGRGKSNPKTISAVENCKLGQYIRVTFVEEKPAKQAGFHPSKLIKVESTGEIKKDVLAAYRESASTMTEVSGSDIPFEDEAV